MIDLMRGFANTGRHKWVSFGMTMPTVLFLVYRKMMQTDMWMKASALSTNSTKIIG